jgi:carboxypeptidase family protein/TonB-dependent receptor-like protein
MDTWHAGKWLAAAALGAFVSAAPAFAQVQRGTIYGTVIDNSGAVLPGVPVQLTSAQTAPQEAVTGPKGEFRFTDLDPGRYAIRATLQGFAPFVRENIIVGVGTSVELPPIRMSVAGVQEEVKVTAASPIIDTKQQGNVANFDKTLLEEVPTSRDPWSLLQQVPGVQLDRVNVGGSESGQQSTFSARGDDGTNTMWNLDGITVTDEAAIGSSATYWDFNAFEEVRFSTSGLDPRQQTGALGINFVTKRGTNDIHGTGRLYYTNDSLQGENISTSLAALGFTGNRIDQIAEYGADVGGPLVRNKVWFWGAAAKNDIRAIAITGKPDNTKLTNYSAKVDVQGTESNHFNFFYYRGEKVKIGRNAAVTRPPETTWNQGGPTEVFKFEDSHIFGSNLFVSGKFAFLKAGFYLTPQSGPTGQVSLDILSGSVWHGGFQDITTDRPSQQAMLDATYYRGRHELRFGFQYRRTPVESTTRWSGDGSWAIVNFGVPGFGLAELTRSGNPRSVQDDTALYAEDVINTGRWTFNLSARFDRQQGHNQASSVAANPQLPDVLPALNFPGADAKFTWNDVSPRVGAAFRIDDKTVVRGSYGRFAEQLRTQYVVWDNPAGLAGIEYLFEDADNNSRASVSELLEATGSVYGFDPANPTAPFTPNRIDPDLRAPITNSLVANIDHEVRPNFAIGAAVGWSRTDRVIWAPYVGITRADYEQVGTLGELVGGVTSNAPVYGLLPGVELPAGNGQFLTNRDGYHTRYYNIDFTAVKRLSNHWMARAYLTRQNNQQFFDDPQKSIMDPTARSYTSPNGGVDQISYVDGGPLINYAGTNSGAKNDVLINARWSYSLLGLYEFPWQVSVSGTIYGREGYPSPYYARLDRGGLGSSSNVLLNPDVNDHRNPALHVLDIRGQKKIRFGGTDASIDVDVFNLFNKSTTLQENRQANSTAFRQPREILAPRIVRFGFRLLF